MKLGVTYVTRSHNYIKHNNLYIHPNPTRRMKDLYIFSKSDQRCPKENWLCNDEDDYEKENKEEELEEQTEEKD